MKKGVKRIGMPTQYLLWEVIINVSLVSCCHSHALVSVVKHCFLQVLASRTEIYIILEFITGGELFDKIVSSSRWNLFCVDFIVAFINHHSRYWKCLMVNNMIVQIYHGHLSEVDSRRYFQQLIDNVDYCHCNGVYHIDLKVCIAWDLKSCLLPLWWFLLIFLFSLCSLKIFYLIH